ncbi:hypothetical protein DFR52_101641 [Hoeflea marina]|uniref:Uncharacterized protein n=1 Tax=Hoeflea marina TaxID=274592 RepID=A0A317PR53_9HYPH|nr:hypothetical protein DFR52_101641 [Hoeflea marina]
MTASKVVFIQIAPRRMRQPIATFQTLKQTPELARSARIAGLALWGAGRNKFGCGPPATRNHHLLTGFRPGDELVEIGLGLFDCDSNHDRNLASFEAGIKQTAEVPFRSRSVPACP